MNTIQELTAFDSAKLAELNKRGSKRSALKALNADKTQQSDSVKHALDTLGHGRRNKVVACIDKGLDDKERARLRLRAKLAKKNAAK
jgi:hypothetical protein